MPPCGEAHLVEMYVRLNVEFCFDCIQPRFHCHVEWIRLRVEFLLKTESGYLRDAEVT